ncbi:hypothetical protein [Hazenella coriacea]|uniref:Uncharacterized protein n=1 Tax=Hazenella coriacea TaxID=1179467 RepID=A0A4R3L738_9BACL|nr:hypothetical protein [Hazenella coriacea]TCS95459.1 hypothetical protein EDD58_10229 [Hazenella coriacea]
MIVPFPVRSENPITSTNHYESSYIVLKTITGKLIILHLNDVEIEQKEEQLQISGTNIRRVVEGGRNGWEKMKKDG